MDELLTTKQLLELLKIDRTTVYRMLNDGRLRGVKIGGQWRFPRKAVEGLVSGLPGPEAPAGSAAERLPIHCLQAIQDVFAEVAGVGAVTVAPDGEPLTRPSNNCRFCRLVLASPAGRAGCRESWRRLVARRGHQPEFVACHAGLLCAYARVELGGAAVAVLVAGQFCVDPPGGEQSARVDRLARDCGVDAPALVEAALDARVLEERVRTRLGGWVQDVAHTFEQVGRERAELVGRLRRIAEMTVFESSEANTEGGAHA